MNDLYEKTEFKENTHPMRPKAIDLDLVKEDLLWSKINKNGPTPDQSNPHHAGLGPCWEWTGGYTTDGYGSFTIKSKRFRASRVVFSVAKGEIPSGVLMLHKCDNRKCVNPDHLFLGDYEMNNRDTSRKGNYPTGNDHFRRKYPERAYKGSKHPMAKANESQVLAIRDMYDNGGYASTVCAQLFGLPRGVVNGIVHRKSWTHI